MDELCDLMEKVTTGFVSSNSLRYSGFCSSNRLDKVIMSHEKKEMMGEHVEGQLIAKSCEALISPSFGSSLDDQVQPPPEVQIFRNKKNT